VSEIERYLDELAERLAGTGDAGMRVLIETEAHLYAAADDAMARGLREDQAEHEAVSRFGPPALVARKLRAAHRGGPVSRALSAAWLLAGSTTCGIGIYSMLPFLVAVGHHGWAAPDCTVALAQDCYLLGGPVKPLSSAAAVVVAGVVLLLCRWLAVRYAGLTTIRRMLARLRHQCARVRIPPATRLPRRCSCPPASKPASVTGSAFPTRGTPPPRS
jgi:hypothetical protein